MTEHTFLIAIGTDELPPKNLKKLGKEFSENIIHAFKKNGISYTNITWFAAPRHLAVKTNILISEKNLNSIKNNSFTINSNNNANTLNYTINTNNLNKLTNDNNQQTYTSHKNNFIKLNYTNKQNFNDLLIKIIYQALEKLTNYKMMRWGTVCIPFIRPVNTITILLDSHLISGRFFDINIDRILHGHRYIKNNKIILHHANDYPNILTTQGHIIVDYHIRKEMIQKQVIKQASKLEGIIDIKNEDFLEEITSLTEWPVVLTGKFDKRFLSLPIEVITYIMQKNQKYFPVYSAVNNKILLPYFIFVINTITDDYQKIIKGHENIIKTRFLDAEFLLKNDSKYRLEEYAPKLHSILFHRKLGSIHDKVKRIIKLSEWIANQIHEDILQTKRAGYLCKCDLISDMVREFPELQGIIGMYYARRDGETEKVALAQKEHYQPKYVTDTVPTERISCIISISDKIDTISGIFGIEKFPTNNKDPFALKRASNGIFNIIVQQQLLLNLTNLIDKSITLYEPAFINTSTIKNNIHNFMRNRLHLYFLSKGYNPHIIKSVLNTNLNDILIYNEQIKSINNFYKFKKQEYFKLNLIYKRISNIIKKQNIYSNNTTIQISLLKHPEEINLFSQIIKIDKEIKLLLQKNFYNIALDRIQKLSNYANHFLDTVIIMDDNNQIRNNRLNLLNTLKNLISKVINFSTLQL